MANSPVKTSDINLLKIYYKDISKYKLLTKEQEILYGKLINIGNIAKSKLDEQTNNNFKLSKSTIANLERKVVKGNKAKEKLILSNLRLVVSYAKKFLGQGLGLEDLIQEGNKGLFKAVERFDYHFGGRFSTYATYWIKQSITRAVQQRGKSIKLPTHKMEHLYKLRKASSALKVELKRDPTIEELSENTGFSTEYINTLTNFNFTIKSLFENVGNDDSDTKEVIDTVADESSPNAEEVVINKALRDELLALISNLNDKENKVIKMRYGLNAENRTYTLDEIGDVIGVSRERVRQIQNKAIEKLRHPSRSKKIEAFIKD